MSDSVPTIELGAEMREEGIRAILGKVFRKIEQTAKLYNPKAEGNASLDDFAGFILNTNLEGSMEIIPVFSDDSGEIKCFSGEEIFGSGSKSEWKKKGEKTIKITKTDGTKEYEVVDTYNVPSPSKMIINPDGHNYFFAVPEFLKPRSGVLSLMGFLTVITGGNTAGSLEAAMILDSKFKIIKTDTQIPEELLPEEPGLITDGNVGLGKKNPLSSLINRLTG